MQIVRSRLAIPEESIFEVNKNGQNINRRINALMERCLIGEIVQAIKFISLSHRLMSFHI